MNVPSRELTAEDLELIEFARTIVDANTDGEFGVHTMGAAVRGADGTMYGASTCTTSPAARAAPTPAFSHPFRGTAMGCPGAPSAACLMYRWSMPRPTPAHIRR